MKHAPLTPIPSPTLPLKGRERCSSPFKGEAGRGMGNVFHVKCRLNSIYSSNPSS
ncbi:MAG: hypothetical protein Q8O31_01585 [Rhodocyclaceae bacterium]|nr:hypothetical protein [Rhodocyclaceae bacterium]